MALARLPVIVFAPLALAALTSSPADAQTFATSAYALNRAASAVGFTMSASMIFKVKEDGSFKDFTGSLSYNPARAADTAIDLTVYTASVDTKNSDHTQLLKSPDFFDVERFPTMHFVSDSTAARPDGTFYMTGDMTIRGVTKRMTIPVKLKPGTNGDESSPMFESNFQIDRTEFGLNGVPKWGGINVSVSKKVDIHIAIATTPNGPNLH